MARNDPAIGRSERSRRLDELALLGDQHKPRTVRAYTTQLRSANTRIRLASVGFSSAITAIANSRYGNES
jgi:hypothetical protein